MALYVDDMKAPLGRMLMSHLIADTPEELRRAADRLGLRRSYIQHPGTWKEHLDVSQSKRQEAVRLLDAREVTMRELAMMLRERREAEQQQEGGVK